MQDSKTRVRIWHIATFRCAASFGRYLSTYLVRIMEPFSPKALGLEIGAFEIIAIKSRVHFRRGFHDNGFAKTILLVEPTEPFLGTVHLTSSPMRTST